MKVSTSFLILLLQTYRGCCKITSKTRLTYFDRVEQYNTWSAYCSNGLTTGSTMVHVDSLMMMDAIQYFLQTEQQWAGGENIWIGLYVDNITTAGLKWQRTCHSFDPLGYHNFVAGVPNALAMDPETLCVLMEESADLGWRIMSCDEKAFGICAENIGACLYEASPTCFGIDANTTTQSAVKTQMECESWCESFLQNNVRECWAYTIVTSSGDCTIYITDFPYSFVKEDIPCSNGEQAFRRRCFQAQYSTFHPEHEENVIPNPYCELSTSTESLTTTTNSASVSTTSSLLTITTTTSSVTTRTTIPTTTTTAFPPSTSSATTTTTALPTSTPAYITTSTQQTKSTNIPTTYFTTTLSSSTEIHLLSTTLNSSSTSSQCYCPCNIINPLGQENKTLEELLEELKEKLVLNKKGLSSHKRKYISAEDERPIAKGLGITVGIGILVTCMALIVAPDVVNVARILQKSIRRPHSKNTSNINLF